MGKCATTDQPPIRLWSHTRAKRHLKQCSANCNKCWRATRGPKWKSFFPWLRYGCRLGHPPGYGFGCSPCAQFQHLRRKESVVAGAPLRPVATPCRRQEHLLYTGKSEFETFTVESRPKSWLLRRHQNGQRHQEAVAFLKGVISEDDLSLAPSVEEFASTLAQVRKGHSMRDGGVASDRTSLLRWCLSEALLQIWRKELAGAKTLCLIRDERKGKLLIRFRGCNGQLKVCSGTFGCVRMKGGTAEDIVSATAKAMRVFCTACFQPPRLGKRLAEQGGLDKKLLSHLRKIVHILTTDSHPAELLASNIMKGNRKSADERHNHCPFLPNVVMVGRDGAHASTRLVKRPWACIPAIQERLLMSRKQKLFIYILCHC